MKGQNEDAVPYLSEAQLEAELFVVSSIGVRESCKLEAVIDPGNSAVTSRVEQPFHAPVSRTTNSSMVLENLRVEPNVCPSLPRAC